MKAILNLSIFREYDIRGVAERDLSDEAVFTIAQAFGSFLQQSGAKTVVVGRDCRLHSPRIHQAFIHGLLSLPLIIIDIGVVPTPLLYFATFHFKTGGGAQITGSHNPATDNGFKLLKGTDSLFGQQLKNLINFIDDKSHKAAVGTVKVVSIVDDYLNFARSRLRMGTRRFKIVVDAGNGTGGVILVPLLESLGFEVIPLYCEMDGTFPHHHPDPTVAANLVDLQRCVAQTGAELGLALDGDADRLAAVDSKGRILWGDQLLILFARAILQEEPDATFLSEVKCSQAVTQEIEKAGGKSVMWKVGHSVMKQTMQEIDAALAAEMSGHLFFAHRYLGFDDAIYAGARLVELLSQSSETLEKHVDSLPIFYNTPEIRVEIPEERKFFIVKELTERLRKLENTKIIDIDGVRIHWDNAWALVRASNTQAMLTMRFEANSAERLEEVKRFIEGEVRKITKM